MRKLQVTARQVRVVASLLLLVGAGTGVLATHYASLLAARHQQLALRRENAQLRTQMTAFEARVAQIVATLDRVDGFDADLRATTTRLQPGQEAAGTGAERRTSEKPPDASGASPTPATPGRPPGDVRTTAGATKTDPIPLIPAHPRADVLRVPSATLPGPDLAVALPALASLQTVADRQESSLRSAQEYFAEQRELLATTPSTWPNRGFVTSDFGDRLDPYTAERTMHRGLDIAAAPGTAIYAPSDATVAFAGTENGYGKVLILDHGNGLNTRYGHLARILVKVGDRVSHGERVATVGSTGRSTGPHLHYEVRVNGIAENPRKFILQ